MAAQPMLTEAEWLAAARRCLGLDNGDDLLLENVRTLVGDGQVLGFVSDGLALRVVVRRGTNGAPLELSMFAKMVPRSSDFRTRLALEMTQKEGAMFARVFPQMEAALRLPVAGPLPRWAPRCFLVRDDLVLLEDLRAQGFRAPGNRYTLDLEECAAALEALATFHAASLALEEAGGAPLPERFPHLLQITLFSEEAGGDLYKYFERSVEALTLLVGQVPEMRHAQRRLADTLRDVGRRLVGPSAHHRNVACHGDIWISNMMVRPASAGVAPAVRLLDFQLPRYAPPAQDVQTLLYTCTRRALRDASGAELLDRYYSALERALDAAGLCAQKLLPRVDLEESCAAYAPFGRLAAAIFHSSNLLPQETLQASVAGELHLVRDRAPLAAAAFAQDPAFRERLTEDLEEIVRLDVPPDSAPSPCADEDKEHADRKVLGTRG